MQKIQWLFVFSFVYTIIIMVLSRELVIPNFLVSSDGNISGDPQYYNFLAVEKLQELQSDGLKTFEIQLNGQGPAGIASLAYLIWQNPYIIVLLNAVMHSLSFVLMVALLSRWFSPAIAIIAALPLLVSPYMMFWFSQINKGSYVMLGVMLFLFGWSKILSIEQKEYWRSIVIGTLLALLGAIFIWIGRPYVNQILAPLSLVVAFSFMLPVFKRSGTVGVLAYLGSTAMIVISLGVLGNGASSDATLKSLSTLSGYDVGAAEEVKTEASVSLKCLSNVSAENWQTAPLLPDYVNDKLQIMMGQRCLIFTLIQTQPNQTTQVAIIDRDILPGGSLDALQYLPRAAYIGILSPGPEFWRNALGERFSWFFVIASLEMIFIYAGLLVLLIWVWVTSSWSIFLPLGVSAYVMTVYGMSIPFLGAIYRYRYPWWMLLICLSAAAILDLAINRRGQFAARFNFQPNLEKR